MRISDLKISISGIRGIVGESLTPQLLIRFSEAFATYIGGGEIAVASDTRPSGPMVRHAVFSGILSCGGSPVDLGILPIPSLQIYTNAKKTAGAVCVTASHNPIEWNALKLIKKGGYFLNPYEAEELLDLYYQGRFSRVAKPEKIKRESNAFSIHLDRILTIIDVEKIRAAKLKVVVDPCGGAAVPYVVSFLEHLGVKVHAIHDRLSGGFPRNPEPIAANLSALCRAVKEQSADIGFAQDADADRLAIVDERGNPVGEEYTLALAVEYFLSKHKSPVVVNLSTTRAIRDIAEKAGVKIYLTKVGEINVSRKMKEVGSAIGGEGNGGIILSEVHTCRDSFSGMALLLEYLAESRARVSELRRALPDYVMIKDKKPAGFRDKKRILARLQEKFHDGTIDKTDGLKIDYPDFWIHVRPSNTEPVIRIMVEAGNRETADQIYSRICKEF